MRASTKKMGASYKGAVLNDKGKVLCLCVHMHRNRDNDSWDYRVHGYVGGQSALTCANKLMTTMHAEQFDEEAL